MAKKTIKKKPVKQSPPPPSKRGSKAVRDPARKPNRAHPKIGKLPKNLQREIHKAVLGGMTYAEVRVFIKAKADKGIIKQEDVPSLSAVGKYSKKFMKRLEQVERVKEQAALVVKKASADGMVLEEAAVNLILTTIIDVLVEENVSQKNIALLSSSLGRLQSSSASRERAKVYVLNNIKRKAGKVADHVEKKAIELGASKKTAREFKVDILGIADEK